MGFSNMPPRAFRSPKSILRTYVLFSLKKLLDSRKPCIRKTNSQPLWDMGKLDSGKLTSQI